MSARTVIIFEVLLQDSSQVTLAEDDHVIHTLSANGSNDSFDVGVLPRRPSRDQHLLDAHGFDSANEMIPVCSVSIP